MSQNLIPASISDNLPAMVRNELSRLEPQKQEEFVEEYRRKSKSTGVAYLLWFLLGWQYAYLGNWGTQLLYWISGAGLLFWAIADLFRIPGLIRNHNKDVATDVLRNQKAISG